MLIYTIRRKSDNKYAKKGWEWSDAPNFWLLGHFKNHCSLFYWNDYQFSSSSVNGLNFGKYLFPKDFKYNDCEVVVLDAASLQLVDTYDAVEWIWHNAAKDYYNNSTHYKANIKAKALELGFEL